MRFLITTPTDFDRPLNISLEDSIHMPQNHNNRNRCRAGNSQALATTPPARNIGTETIQRGSQIQTSSHQGYSTPACDEEPSTFGRTKPIFVMANAEPRVVLPISQTEKRKHSNPWTEGYEQEVRSRIRRGDFRPVAEGQQDLDKKPEPSAEKVPYSKIHEQKSAPRTQTQTEFSYASEAEAPPSSPIRLVNRSSSGASTASPTLRHVRKLRSDEQDRVFAQLGEDLGTLVSRPDGPVKGKKRSIEQTNSSLFIPRLNLSGSDWSKPLHAIANLPKPAMPEMEAVQSKRPGVSTPAKAQPVVSRGPHQKSQIEKLAEAMAEIDVFQNIAAKPPTAYSSEHQVVVPKRLALNIALTTEKSVEEEANKSTDSIASFHSDDFEKVDMPEVGESEQNGAPKKWFGGFRR